MKNTNKEIYSILGAMLMAMLLLSMQTGMASAQQASAEGTPLSITNLQVSPTPVVAGDTVNISFQLFNSYSQPLTDVNIQLVSPDQILNVSPQYSSIATSIGTGLVGAIGVDEFSYAIHIPSTLPAGEYTIYVVSTYRTVETSATGQNIDTPGESEIPIDIYVYGKPAITATALPSTQITPGNPFELGITLSNAGTDTAMNVTMQLHGASGLAITGTPKFSLGTMAVGVPISIDEPMFALDNLSNGVHNITATINYTNELGHRMSENVTMPISVALNVPHITVSLIGSMPPELYAGSNQSLQLQIENSGTGEARNVSVSFTGSPSIDVGSSVDHFFISSLPSGASATEELYINSYSDNFSNTSITANAHYWNADLSTAFNTTEPISIHVQPSAIFNITSEAASLNPGATYVPITVTVRNTGNEEAQAVLLTLESVYPISTVSSTNYINSLAPGASENATFYVSVDSNGKPGSYPITLYEQWKQPNSPQSQEFVGSSFYYAKVESSSSTAGIAEEAIAIVAVIIIIVVAVRVSRKRKMSHSEKPKRKV